MPSLRSAGESWGASISNVLSCATEKRKRHSNLSKSKLHSAQKVEIEELPLHLENCRVHLQYGFVPQKR
jgi:hypothetical protein